jgi:hypothetical protein
VKQQQRIMISAKNLQRQTTLTCPAAAKGHLSVSLLRRRLQGGHAVLLSPAIAGEITELSCALFLSEQRHAASLWSPQAQELERLLTQ